MTTAYLSQKKVLYTVNINLMLFESHKIAWAMQESKQFTEGIYEYYTVPKVHKSWMFWEPNQIIEVTSSLRNSLPL